MPWPAVIALAAFAILILALFVWGCCKAAGRADAREMTPGEASDLYLEEMCRRAKRWPDLSGFPADDPVVNEAWQVAMCERAGRAGNETIHDRRNSRAER